MFINKNETQASINRPAEKNDTPQMQGDLTPVALDALLKTHLRERERLSQDRLPSWYPGA